MPLPASCSIRPASVPHPSRPPNAKEISRFEGTFPHTAPSEQEISFRTRGSDQATPAERGAKDWACQAGAPIDNQIHSSYKGYMSDPRAFVRHMMTDFS